MLYLTSPTIHPKPLFAILFVSSKTSRASTSVSHCAFTLHLRFFITMRLSRLLSASCLLLLASAAAVPFEKRDADFHSLRKKKTKDMSGREGDPPDKYFRMPPWCRRGACFGTFTDMEKRRINVSNEPLPVLEMASW